MLRAQLTNIWLQPNLIASFRRELSRYPTLLTVTDSRRLWESELLSPFQFPTKRQYEQQLDTLVYSDLR